MKLVEFAYEIILDEKLQAKCYVFHTFWNNSYALYFKKDDLKNEPLKIVPINEGKSINKFELKLLEKSIMQVAKECSKF